MRDPKTHAKVLALRWKAVGGAVNLATLRGDFTARNRLMHLQQRVIDVMDLHEGKTGWAYTPLGGRNLSFWTCTDIDTREES